MRIPVGVIKEWQRKQEEKRRREEESRRPGRAPLPWPDQKRPDSGKEDRRPRNKIVINLS